jgi:mono/diheme cytochrome c family protein
MPKHATLAALLWAAAASGAAQDWNAPPDARALKRPDTSDAKALERGKRLFQQNCVPCHGAAGKGDGPMGKAMGIKPGNLGDAARMTKQADGELFWKISKGKDPMPVFEKKLSEKERWDLVAYVRTLAN